MWLQHQRKGLQACGQSLLLLLQVSQLWRTARIMLRMLRQS